MFLPGPGPLEQAPHAPVDGALAAPDAWATATQGSTRPAAYAPVRSSTVAIYDPATNRFADWTPEPIVSRASVPYAAPRSLVAMQPDASSNTFADWAPEPVVARIVPRYSAPVSQSISATSPNPPPDTVASIAATNTSTPRRYATISATFGAADQAVVDSACISTTSRVVPYYAPQHSVIVAVGDPALNTFADWAQPPVTSRSTPLYTPPRSQTRERLGDGLTPDATVLAAASTITRLYTPPRSVSVSITDPALNTFADWVPPQVVSRSVLAYAAPRSQILTPINGPSSIPDTAALPTTQTSSPIRYYTGPRSQTLWLVDPALNTFADWAPEPVTSRPVPAYSPPRAQVIAATSGPATVFDVVIFSPVLASTPARFYTAPRSQAMLTTDATTNTFADWAPQLVASRVLGIATRPRSVTSLTADQTAAAPTDSVAFVALSPPAPRRYTTFSSTFGSADQAGPVAGGTAYVALTQSRTQTFYRGSYSLTLFPWPFAAPPPPIQIKGYSAASDAIVYGTTAGDSITGGALVADAGASGATSVDTLAGGGSASSDTPAFGASAGDA